MSIASLSKTNQNRIICFLLFVLCLVVFTRGLSHHGVEYRDDEVFYYQSTKEMIEKNDYMSPTYFGQERFQKPILFYWLILLSYKIFGLNWFGARFVAVLFASLAVCTTWLMGKELFDRKIATLSVFILMTIPLFFRHAKTVVPDMALNFFIVFAIYCLIKIIKNSGRERYKVLFFISCALGFMIKGFVAILIPFLTLFLYLLSTRKLKLIPQLRPGRGILIMAMVIAPWFLYMFMTYGQDYLNYMIVDETKNRLLNREFGFFSMNKLADFFKNCFYYVRIILSYFAPWSLFIFLAIPLGFMRRSQNQQKNEALSLLLIWFFVVFFFFCLMFFVINHYMMALTTPFAILVSFFFFESFDLRGKKGKIELFFKKYIPIILLTLGIAIYSFLLVFFTGAAKWWLGIFLAIYVFMITWIHRRQTVLAAPLSLALFIVFMFSQSTLLGKARITAFSALEKFAQTIHQQKSNPSVVGVGSHDIHEKEFQVYFDQKVYKAATSDEDVTQKNLRQFFNDHERVYCLMTEEDFRYHFHDPVLENLKVIQEDYILRRRMYLDKNFWGSLFRLDQKKVFHYLMEKIVLVHKDLNA